MPRPLTTSSIEQILHIWCDGKGWHWECDYLLDRASWDAHRRANHVRGIDLPSADWVLYLANTTLYDVVNQTDPDDPQYNELLAYLRPYGLTLHRLTPHYARLVRLQRKNSG